MATLAQPKHLRKQTQNPSQFSHRITELATLLGNISKSGVTLGFLNHVYMITLIALIALLFGFLVWVYFKSYTWIWGLFLVLWS